MRVLITSNVRWWNAEAAYAATVARELRKAGHKVWVLTLANTLNETKLRQWNLPLVTDIPLNSANPLRLRQAYQKLRQFIEDHQIQVVNPHRSEGFFLFLLLRWKLQSFALIRTRGTTRPLRKHWINRKIYRDGMEAVITPGNVVAKRMQHVVDLPPERLRVIYYPPPERLQELTDSEAQRELRQAYSRELGIPESHRVISIVGRIRAIKGQRDLLRSFAQLKERFPETSLLILYRDTHETEREWQALLKDLMELGLRESVYLYGYRNDVQEIMRYVDIGVVSSGDSEVICRVAVEFFSVGTPVVAFPTGALPEIVRDGVNGRVTKDHSVDSLTEALEWMLEDPARIVELGRNALHDALTRFAPQRLIEDTLSTYEYALEQVTALPPQVGHVQA
jgi:glycosyltransferase involved in cell wall biosynthesis